MFLEKSDVDREDNREKWVVKTNKLVTAIENLTLAETRLIQLAIIGARANNGLNAHERLKVSLESYAKTFNTTTKSAYHIMTDADKSLRKKSFYFLEDGDKGSSNWVQESIYKSDDRVLEILFTTRVINEITNIQGFENFFTQYRLSQTNEFTSIYSLRLFELLTSWVKLKKTPEFDVNSFRKQLGVEDHEYSRMSNFKARVLDVALKEINNKSNLTVEVNDVTKGRKITAFWFTIKEDKPTYKRIKITIKEAIEIGLKLEGAKVGESETEVLKRVYNHKNEDGKSIYHILDSKADWDSYNKEKRENLNKIKDKSDSYKDVVIGNVVIDDLYISQNKLKNESKDDARIRLINEAKKLQEESLYDDRPLSEILGLKK